MKFSIISFTENGVHLSEQIYHSMKNLEISLYTKFSGLRNCVGREAVSYVEEPLADWAGKQMKERRGLLFIGACGIAVRAIAPHITDKLTDSPVLVMDEMGNYVIPILAGHVGGANELALQLSEKTKATPVLTTASDLNHCFAVDLFAKKNHLSIMNKDGIAKVTSRLLQNQSVSVTVEPGHLETGTRLPEGLVLQPYEACEKTDILIASNKDDKDALIWLCPKEYVVGIGCKKGKSPEELKAFLDRNLKKTGIRKDQIAFLASVDLKKEEPCLLAYSQETGIPFLTFSSEQLQQTEGNFHTSEFVKSTIGVDNVCERAALCACGKQGTLIMEKQAENGMTMAIAKRKWSVTFDEK